MKARLIILLFIFIVIHDAALGLQMPGKAVGNVSPLKGAIYLSSPTPGIEKSTLCNLDEIYTFTYRFDMKNLPNSKIEDIQEVNLMMFNPEEGAWMWVASKEYNQEDEVLFKVDYRKLIESSKETGSPYNYKPFIGMSKFKLVGERLERRQIDGLGFQEEKTVTPDIAFRESLSDEILGPEIIANFRNPKGSKDQFNASCTYSVEVKTIKPLNVIIVGTKDNIIWYLYGDKNQKTSKNIWRELEWKNAPLFSKLEFIIDNCT